VYIENDNQKRSSTFEVKIERISQQKSWLRLCVSLRHALY